MTVDLEDTIAAIASAPGGALRGIIRLSGPLSIDVAARLFVADANQPLPKPRLASCRRGQIHLPPSLGLVPTTLYLWPTTSSYTRQPSAEFHLPGSPPILEVALEVVCGQGVRLARPGEFTLRAFLAGRLDLTQAEAVLGVIEARSRPELDAALMQLAGGLAKPLSAIRGQLLDLLAQLEAGLDFVDEDIEFISREELERQLTSAVEAITSLAEQMKGRGEAGTLPRVVLCGLPNAGKSSLLNALAGETAAIVSAIAGTTRDFVTRRLQLGQSECLVSDTAGLVPEDQATELDAAAQAAAREQIRQAELLLVCLDASRLEESLAWLENDELGTCERRIVWTKCDLVPNELHKGELTKQSGTAVLTSSCTGEGIDSLRRIIGEALGSRAGESCAVVGTAERCRDSIRRSLESLERARLAVQEELVAAEIRIALDEMGQVAGETYTDDILDRIFSRFCIGK